MSITIVFFIAIILIVKYYSKRIKNLKAIIRDTEIIFGHFGSDNPKYAIQVWERKWESQIKSNFEEDYPETTVEITYSALSFFEPCPFDDLKTDHYDQFTEDFEQMLKVKYPDWDAQIKWVAAIHKQRFELVDLLKKLIVQFKSYNDEEYNVDVFNFEQTLQALQLSQILESTDSDCYIADHCRDFLNFEFIDFVIEYNLQRSL